ncbi:TM2 domain-containing protein [Sebaldella sp. S0638]|uniref:TM2 domain-containing protein n=1 Tax=Sebaldella sp. S0638 TaxID=2957809 RepID=UPI00209CF70B|nr:TM2 domain-containing protein [Sebaldella sp. S0638]MCP1226093.1 TM2 domain-containing protein [Sebaldella sp. S0638]
MGRYDDDFSVFEEKRERVDVNYGKRAVHKVVYALLAIFLGWLGIHKFYAGKPVQGIIYILFSWTGIPSIIAFIEGIVALLKDSDAYGNIYL